MFLQCFQNGKTYYKVKWESFTWEEDQNLRHSELDSVLNEWELVNKGPYVKIAPKPSANEALSQNIGVESPSIDQATNQSSPLNIGKTAIQRSGEEEPMVRIFLLVVEGEKVY